MTAVYHGRGEKMEGYELYRLSDEEIQHVGVKGMKWGKRKSRSAYMTAVDKHEAKTKANRQKVAAHKAREKAEGKAAVKKYMDASRAHETKTNARRSAKVEKRLAKKDDKWEKKFDSKKDVTAAKAFNAAVPKMNDLIKKHQEKGKNWTEDDPRWKGLEDEFGKEFGTALNSYLNKSPDAVSPSGKKRVEAVIIDNLNFRIEVVDIK